MPLHGLPWFQARIGVIYLSSGSSAFAVMVCTQAVVAGCIWVRRSSMTYWGASSFTSWASVPWFVCKLDIAILALFARQSENLE